MKSCLIFVAICFAALTTGSAEEDDREKLSCLYDSGLRNAFDMLLLSKILKPGSEIPRVPLEKNYACAIACQFNKEKKPDQTLYGQIEKTINIDNEFPDDKKKEMLNTLKNCHDNDGGDDCKLLQCIDITRPPFVRTIGMIKNA